MPSKLAGFREILIVADIFPLKGIDGKM